VSLSLGWFLGRAADLTNIKRGRYRDDAGVDFPINAEHPDQRAALITALGLLGTEATLEAIRDRLIATPATAAAQETQRLLLAQIVTLLTSEGGYLDGVEALLGTGNGSLGQIVTALARVKVNIPAAAQVQTIVTLTALQAAGTDPLIGANANRQAIQFGAATDFKIALTAAATDGLRIYASARDDLSGKLCPLGGVYLVPASGLAAGDTVVIWEAT
jgi:hypothetical protein